MYVRGGRSVFLGVKEGEGGESQDLSIILIQASAGGSYVVHEVGDGVHDTPKCLIYPASHCY